MEKLKEEGYISKSPNKNRAVNFKRNSSVNIPLIGTVTAGQPIFAYENYEDYYSFPADSFHGSELFMLNVQGTSMIDAGICDGDKIVVRQTAERGQRRYRGRSSGRQRDRQTLLQEKRLLRLASRKRDDGRHRSRTG